MRASSLAMTFMAKAVTRGLMGVGILVNGSRIRWGPQAQWDGLMVEHMREILPKARSMVMVRIAGQMADPTVASGAKASNMARVQPERQEGKSVEGCGRMANFSNGLTAALQLQKMVTL